MNEIRPNQASGTNPPRFDDEIDLIDLAVSLWKRKWVVAAFLALGVLLGAVAATLQEDGHEVSAVLTIGTINGEDGRELVQSTSTIVNWLETSLLPAAAKQQAADSSIKATELMFDVKNGEGDSVTIRAQTSEALVQPHVAAIKWAADRVADTADKPIRNHKSNLRSNIRNLELKLERLQDTDRLMRDRMALKQKISAKQNKLASLADRERSLKEQLDRLARMIEIQQARADDINSYLGKLQWGDAALTSAATANEAMTVMLLGNQVQRHMDQLASINQQITVTLPQKVSEAQTTLADIERQQGQLQTDVEQSKLALKTFNTDHAREIRQLELAIADKQAQLKNIQETGLLTQPRVSKASGQSANLIVTLGAILGLFAGLFAALMVGFVSAARERLHETESTQD